MTPFRVQGMTCDHCVRAVIQEVGAVAHVTKVDVDLPTGVVTITSGAPIDTVAVEAAVAEAGYEVVR